MVFFTLHGDEADVKAFAVYLAERMRIHEDRIFIRRGVSGFLNFVTLEMNVESIYRKKRKDIRLLDGPELQ